MGVGGSGGSLSRCYGQFVLLRLEMVAVSVLGGERFPVERTFVVRRRRELWEGVRKAKTHPQSSHCHFGAWESSAASCAALRSRTF